MTKVYLLPIDRLNFDDLRKAFKQAKADARSKSASTVEGEKNVPKTT